MPSGNLHCWIASGFMARGFCSTVALAMTLLVAMFHQERHCEGNGKYIDGDIKPEAIQRYKAMLPLQVGIRMTIHGGITMQKLICNPMNLDYRYQVRATLGADGVLGEMNVHREGADPTMVLFKDHYLLFVSMTGGFWYSDDLFNWNFKSTPELPIYDYAPDVAIVNDAIIFSASKSDGPCSIYRSENPLHEPFTAVAESFMFWDPAIFQDDDGRVYLYWGCSNIAPIYGVEVDPMTFQNIGPKFPLICENEDIHGWERIGENNLGNPSAAKRDKPWIEGAFMNKVGGKYYFQYSGPGTSFNVYADGVYVAETPLGPFTYQAHNPFSSKPGGFATGAGHGSTFFDKYGNMWHVSTMRLSVNAAFERRIGLFPCGIDASGILHCNQHFADYPFVLPNARVNPEDIKPTHMLLSYKKATTASSFWPGFETEKAVDEDMQTWWAAGSSSSDEFLELDLGAAYAVAAIQLNFADHQVVASDVSPKDLTQGHSAVSKRLIMPTAQRIGYLLEYSLDGTKWETLWDTRNANTDLPHELITLATPITLRHLRISNMAMPFDAVPAISGLRVFGDGSGAKPSPVMTFSAQREADGVAANLSWQAVEGAIGYNVRYGIAADKLYSSWQVYEKTALRLSTLNRGTAYYIAVDSFNEAGVTPGEIVELV